MQLRELDEADIGALEGLVVHQALVRRPLQAYSPLARRFEAVVTQRWRKDDLLLLFDNPYWLAHAWAAIAAAPPGALLGGDARAIATYPGPVRQLQGVTRADDDDESTERIVIDEAYGTLLPRRQPQVAGRQALPPPAIARSPESAALPTSIADAHSLAPSSTSPAAQQKNKLSLAEYRAQQARPSAGEQEEGAKGSVEADLGAKEAGVGAKAEADELGGQSEDVEMGGSSSAVQEAAVRARGKEDEFETVGEDKTAGAGAGDEGSEVVAEEVESLDTVEGSRSSSEQGHAVNEEDLGAEVRKIDGRAEDDASQLADGSTIPPVSASSLQLPPSLPAPSKAPQVDLPRLGPTSSSPPPPSLPRPAPMSGTRRSLSSSSLAKPTPPVPAFEAPFDPHLSRKTALSTDQRPSRTTPSSHIRDNSSRRISTDRPGSASSRHRSKSPSEGKSYRGQEDSSNSRRSSSSHRNENDDGHSRRSSTSYRDYDSYSHSRRSSSSSSRSHSSYEPSSSHSSSSRRYESSASSSRHDQRSSSSSRRDDHSSSSSRRREDRTSSRDQDSSSSRHHGYSSSSHRHERSSSSDLRDEHSSTSSHRNRSDPTRHRTDHRDASRSSSHPDNSRIRSSSREQRTLRSLNRVEEVEEEGEPSGGEGQGWRPRNSHGREEDDIGQERWNRRGRGWNETPSTSADPRSLGRWTSAPSPSPPPLPPGSIPNPRAPAASYGVAYLDKDLRREGDDVYTVERLARSNEWQRELFVREVVDKVFLEKLGAISFVGILLSGRGRPTTTLQVTFNSIQDRQEVNTALVTSRLLPHLDQGRAPSSASWGQGGGGGWGAFHRKKK